MVSPYMTVKEVARYLKISTTSVYRLIHEGKIPAFKIGSDHRFIRSAIDEWIASQTLPKSRTGRYEARLNLTPPVCVVRNWASQSNNVQRP